VRVQTAGLLANNLSEVKDPTGDDSSVCNVVILNAEGRLCAEKYLVVIGRVDAWCGARCTIGMQNNICYNHHKFKFICDFCRPIQEGKIALDPALLGDLHKPEVRDFFSVLAICNTVVVSSTGQVRSRVEAISFLDNCITDEYLNKMKYEAESPDEAALVKVCGQE